VIRATDTNQASVSRFRTKLLVAMMLMVCAITTLALYFAQQNVTLNVERDLQREFQDKLAALHNVQEIRHAALVERCRALVRKPRIHAALEDNALDLLYPSAKDELRDVMEVEDDQSPEQVQHALHAKFYRFLDGNGEVIPSPKSADFGLLKPSEEAQLSLHRTPDRDHPQIGYLVRHAADGSEAISEIIAMPIISSETSEVIAAIVLGFKPLELGNTNSGSEIKSGIWLDGRLHLSAVAPSLYGPLAQEVTRAIAREGRTESNFNLDIAGKPHLIFYKRLNPDSLFPATYEVCIYSLDELRARQRKLLWEGIGAGMLLLLGGLAASHILSGRLSVPVEKLAVYSEQNRAQRERAEAALELTHEELQRSARFSADASHQLKTPVTVLRAGLEELLALETLGPEVREELATLVHQTFRLSSVIEDLLLLSRMDAGHVKIEFSPVDLTRLIEAWLDDLGALPDPLNLTVETDMPKRLHIAGEQRYTTLILQNLLENARKYNRQNGRIHVSAREDADCVVLTIGNTGGAIPPEAQDHIFERFHRGTIGENVAGYGLGLNLALELARIHKGNLRLARSSDDWTEFEARFQLASSPTSAGL
jgi:signal transduction histidine kinase